MCSDLFIKFRSPWIEFEESPSWEIRHEHRSGGQVDQRISTGSAVLDKDCWLQSWLPVNEDWLSLQNRVNLCHCWRVGFDLASILQWHINLIVVNTILSSQIFLITDPSGLEAIISSSSSPYRTCWTWKYLTLKKYNLPCPRGDHCQWHPPDYQWEPHTLGEWGMLSDCRCKMPPGWSSTRSIFQTLFSWH